MSREAAVSVPGKAILLGEHAAVYGHPALVTAVDLRLSVTARRADAPGVAVARSSEFRNGWMPRSEVDELCRGSEAPGDRLAYLAAGAALLHAGAPGETGIELDVASAIPPGSGLGSSAALAVAVVAAVFAWLGHRADAATVARVAKEVETRQHGRPSGVDVEAVLRGGTLWCERSAGALTCTPHTAHPAPFDLYHAGTPAESTGEMVSSVARRRDDDPASVSEAMEAIASATREARDALADAARLAPLVRRAEAALEALGVVPASVASAIRGIEAQGGAAKISGAGGRAAGAGLVLVLPPASGLTVPNDWRPLRAALGAPGLREDVPA